MHRATMTVFVVAALSTGCQWGQEEKRSEARLSDAAGVDQEQGQPPEDASDEGMDASETSTAPREAQPAEAEPPRRMASTPRVRVEPPPTPPPTPTPLPPIEVAAGTKFAVTLQTAVSSADSRRGDSVKAVVAEDVVVDGRVAIGAGSELHGRVTAADGAGRVKGRARLAFTFEELVMRGSPHDISVRPIDITAQSEKKRDAAVVGGGAGVGAVVGAIAGGKKGAAIGAAVGAGAGSGAVLATKGKEVEMGRGHTLQVRLTETLILR